MALVVLTFASAALTAALSRLRTWTSRSLTAATIALSMVFVHTPPLARLLHLEPLHLGDWALALIAGVLACLPVMIRFRAQR